VIKVESHLFGSALLKYVKGFDDLEINQVCDCLNSKLIQSVENKGIRILLVNKLKDFNFIDQNDRDFIEEFIETAKPDNILMRYYLKARMISLVQDNNVAKAFLNLFKLLFNIFE
jgi:hypothetical protein